MTTPFTASNGLTVQRLGLNRFRVRGPYGSDVERALIQGEATLRALVEYAATIGITAPAASLEWADFQEWKRVKAGLSTKGEAVEEVVQAAAAMQLHADGSAILRFFSAMDEYARLAKTGAFEADPQ